MTKQSRRSFRLREVWPRPAPASTTLPPGQGVVLVFPRYGAQVLRPAPTVRPDPIIRIRGALTAGVDFPVAALRDLPRQERVADFHCVAGWTAPGLRWDGVPFRALYAAMIAPQLRPGARVSHLLFAGLDGYQAVLTLEDALQPDVLVADRLDGAPLPGMHGAPARLLSPSQYGYKSTKHLCRIEVHTREVSARHAVWWIAVLLALLQPHPRARVWREERHRYLPPRAVRVVYRFIHPVLAYLCQHGASQEPGDHDEAS